MHTSLNLHAGNAVCMVVQGYYYVYILLFHLYRFAAWLFRLPYQKQTPVNPWAVQNAFQYSMHAPNDIFPDIIANTNPCSHDAPKLKIPLQKFQKTTPGSTLCAIPYHQAGLYLTVNVPQKSQGRAMGSSASLQLCTFLPTLTCSNAAGPAPAIATSPSAKFPLQ